MSRTFFSLVAGDFVGMSLSAVFPPLKKVFPVQEISENKAKKSLVKRRIEGTKKDSLNWFIMGGNK